MDDINIEEFINEIEMRPAVWNTKCENYCNRLEKKNAWDGICEKFIKNFHNKSTSDKKLTATLLQNKWRHIRDSYSRELGKQRKMKSGSAAKNHRKYVYFDQLKFLSQIYEKKSTDAQEQSESSEGGLASTSKTEKSTNNEETNTFLKLLAEKMQNNAGADNFEDGDRYFLLSLLNDFKKIPENRKMDAKYDIIGVIRKYAVSDLYTGDNFNTTSQYDQSGYFTNPVNQSPGSHRPEFHIQFESTSNEIQKLSPKSNLSANSDESLV